MVKNQNFKRVWLITGASRGFGAKIAAAALADGDAVVATARDAQKILENFDSSPALLALNMDIQNEAQVKEVMKQAVQQFGRIDVLVNNAGFGLLGAVEESSADDVKRIYETNVFGLLNVTRAALPYMRKQHSGHIINFSSLGGYHSSAGFGVYCSTKFAIEGLSEALYTELLPLGIHVTVVEPGYFRTDFLDSTSLSQTKNQIDDYHETAGQTRLHAKEISHKQPGDPDKLATAILKLASLKNPPLRLPLGTDAIKVIEEKNAFVNQELEKWRTLAESTNF